GGVPVTTGMFLGNAYDLIKVASIAGPENGQNYDHRQADVSLTWQPMADFSMEAFYSIGSENREDKYFRKENTNVLRYSGVQVVNGVAVLNPAGGRLFESSFVTYQPQPWMTRQYGRVSAFYRLTLPFTRQDFRIGAEVFDQGPRYQKISRITTPGTLTPISL